MIAMIVSGCAGYVDGLFLRRWVLASPPEVVLSIVYDYADGCSRDIVCFTRGLQNEGLNTDFVVYWLKLNLNFAGLLEYRNQILQKPQIRGFRYVFTEKKNH